MMNKILKDLINEGKVATFVDNVLVRTETEKEYDEIVEKILRRLKENDLYVKSEKYVYSHVTWSCDVTLVTFPALLMYSESKRKKKRKEI